MKSMTLSLMLAAVLLAPLSHAAAAEPSFIGDSGTYGPIDTDSKAKPRPRLIFATPKTAERGASKNKPIYLRVPADHAKNWNDHCLEYKACDRPAYFVQDSWYNKVYVPALRAKAAAPAAQ